MQRLAVHHWGSSSAWLFPYCFRQEGIERAMRAFALVHCWRGSLDHVANCLEGKTMECGRGGNCSRPGMIVWPELSQSEQEVDEIPWKVLYAILYLNHQSPWALPWHSPTKEFQREFQWEIAELELIMMLDSVQSDLKRNNGLLSCYRCLLYLVSHAKMTGVTDYILQCWEWSRNLFCIHCKL